MRMGLSDARTPAAKSMELFVPPKAEELIEDLEDKLNLAAAGKSSLKVLKDSIELLGSRIGEIDKAKDLSRVATDMGKVAGTINDIKHGKDSVGKQQLVIWQPIIMQEINFETIHVSE